MANIHLSSRMGKVLIRVTDSYDIKDQLKAQGYRYDRKGWETLVESTPEAVVAEIKALEELGARLWVFELPNSRTEENEFMVKSEILMNIIGFENWDVANVLSGFTVVDNWGKNWTL